MVCVFRQVYRACNGPRDCGVAVSDLPDTSAVRPDYARAPPTDSFDVLHGVLPGRLPELVRL